MKRHPNAKIVDGEIYGAPVPGGWPDRGPFQVLGDALGGLFRRRNSKDRARAQRPQTDDSSGAASAQLAQQQDDE